jgi:hypothetical protein
MNKVKNILGSVLFGVFGFALSLCIAPIVAVVVVGYMTKVSFEIGYQEMSVEEIDKLHQELNDHESQ